MRWKQDEIDFMSVALEEGWSHKDIANELERTTISVSHKANNSDLISLNYNKTHETYAKQIPKDIETLESYIGADTKIVHKHICGFIWKVKPSSILSGHGCPMCNSSFNAKTPGVLYLIYFPELDIYKFGISNKYIVRMKHFGSTPEIILIREFDLGLEARELENEWSKNVDYLKINTGCLTSGNTETFVY